MVSETQRSLPSPPSLEGGDDDFKEGMGPINRATAVEALYRRGIMWLAEGHAQYDSTTPSGATRARRPNAIQPFGITEIDTLLPEGGLLPGSAHELFVESDLKNAPSAIVSTIGAIVHRTRLRGKTAPPKFALWIGKSTWPTPHFLEQIFHTPLYPPSPQSTSFGGTSQRALSNCLFLDPPSEKAAFWSIDSALRSPAVGVVIASLPKISFALSRRFLLAARTGKTIGIFYRPISVGKLPKDTPTAFTTRWLIRPEVSMTAYPRWNIELLKYKGSPPRQTTWSVELCGSDDDQNVPLHLSSPVADRRRTSTASGEDERSRQRA